MADWTLGTDATAHLAEHNAFNHDGVATPAAGKIIGVSGGKFTQVDLVKSARRITASGTMLASDGVILVNSDGGAVTVTLLALSSANLMQILIKRTGSNNVVIDASGAEVINTDGSTALTKTLGSNGAQWSGIASSADSAWLTVGESGTVT